MSDPSDATVMAGQVSLEKLLDILMRTSIEKADVQQGNQILRQERAVTAVIPCCYFLECSRLYPDLQEEDGQGKPMEEICVQTSKRLPN